MRGGGGGGGGGGVVWDILSDHYAGQESLVTLDQFRFPL